MIEFLTTLLLWLSVLVPSSILASFTAKRSKRRAGVTMQLAILLLTLALMWLMDDMERFGLKWSFGGIIPAFILGFGLSFVLNMAEGPSSEINHEFLPKKPLEKLFLLLFLAPLSEELLNRGLILGYLTPYGHVGSAMVFSAFLFAIPHWMAFEGRKRSKLLTVIGAIILGSLAGYFFVLSGSIVPAVTLHSSANLAGLVVLKLRETPRYK